MAVAVHVHPETYAPHWLHEESADWSETNCYVDVVIELLNVLGHDPVAALGFTLRMDLEADQFTFFKYRHADLEAFYGLEIIETNPWTTVVDQVAAEVDAGRVPLIEVDSYFLPDTAGTAYQLSHVKTTIAVLAIDVSEPSIVYAHNRSIHRVSGADARGLLSAADTAASFLPPYIETVRIGGAPTVARRDHHGYAIALLRAHMVRVPEQNPYARFRTRFEKDLDRLAEGGMPFFHSYAFATFRQFGAASSLAAAHLDWLGDGDESLREPFGEASVALRQISQGARTLQLRCARTAMTGKRVDATSHFDAFERNWEIAIGLVRNVAASSK